MGGAAASDPPPAAPAGTDRGQGAGRHRQRSRFRRGRCRRGTGGDRHRHAAGHELAGWTARLGRAHRSVQRGPYPGCPPRGRPRWALPRGPAAPSPRLRRRLVFRDAGVSAPFGGRYRAVVFDMDGLLLDTEILWHEAESELFRRHGGEFTWDDKLTVIGTSFAFTADYFADRLGLPREDGPALVEEMIELMHDRVRRQVDARPGAMELVV